MKERINALSPIVGYYFHEFRYIFDEGEDDPRRVLESQGQIVNYIGDGFYLIEYLNWIDGGPSYKMVVNTQTLSHFALYETNDDMLFSYEHGYAAKLK